MTASEADLAAESTLMASRLFVGAVSDILFEINVTSNLGSSVHRSICRTARGSSSGSCQRPGYPSAGPRSFLNRNMPVFRRVGPGFP